MRCTQAAAGFRGPHKTLADKKGWGAGAPWLVGRGEDVEDILRMLAGFSNEQWGRVMNTLHATCVDKGLHYVAPDLMRNVCTALAVA